MKYKHLIISRLAIKWYTKDGETLRCEEELGQTWDEWLASTIKLYSTYTRESLRKQSNQNFTLISVVDESVDNIGELLPNEVVLKIKAVKDLVPAVTKFIEDNYKSPLYLMSRIDRDDCFGVTYVQELQNLANEYLGKNESPEPFYFDIVDIKAAVYDGIKIDLPQLEEYLHLGQPGGIKIVLHTITTPEMRP